jgi:glucose-1-phosphate thymidylyltransferase
MKGIVLAGGTGSRLRPLTSRISKHLLPVFDKPMIFYPISTLLLAGVKEISVVVTPSQEDLYRAVLGDGSRWGISLSLQVQASPGGLPQAIGVGIGENANSSHLVILGDNIFHGVGLGQSLKSLSMSSGAVAFAHEVVNPQDYGVIEVDNDLRVLSLEEKPVFPKSNLAIPGLYCLDENASGHIEGLAVSERGEFEIVDLLRRYLNEGGLRVEKLQRGTAWFDAGSAEALFSASEYIKVMQDRQGGLVGSPDEVAWRLGLISDQQLEGIVSDCSNSSYGKSLARLLL